MLFIKKEAVHPEQSFIFRLRTSTSAITRDYKGEHFFVRNKG